MIEKIVPGQIVKSKAGHDMYKHFVVTEVLDKDYVLIADGKSRKIDNPKKKKITHLIFLNDNAFKIEDFTLTDKFLNKLTKRYNEGDKY